MAKARGRASVPIAQIGGSAYLLCGQAGPTLRPSRPGVATVRIMTLTLCVSLWPRPDQEAQLVEYEDKVLALLQGKPAPVEGAPQPLRVQTPNIVAKSNVN